MTRGYDIVGDVHGHASELERLLAKLGYEERGGSYRHPDDRHLVFVGDLVDRGPDQLRVVEIARRMQDAGRASIVMGNHEFNAVGWAMPDPSHPGEFLRRHHERHRRQHRAFLEQVGENGARHHDLVAWMRTLPLWLDLEGFRVVHACWHPPSLEALRPHLTRENVLTEEGWLAVHERRPETGTSPARDAAEIVLKGLETKLPPGRSFLDKDGNRREEARVRWWDASARTIRAAALYDDEATRHLLPDEALPIEAIVDYDGRKPVFFGHYWLKAEAPVLVSDTMACLDYSVAKGGSLVAYEWNGEQRLRNERLTRVRGHSS